MRDPKRISIVLEAVKTLWEKYPDLRLGQLLSNYFTIDEDLYYVEDEVLLDKINTAVQNDHKSL